MVKCYLCIFKPSSVDVLIIVQFCVTQWSLKVCRCSCWKFSKSFWIWYLVKRGNPVISTADMSTVLCALIWLQAWSLILHSVCELLAVVKVMLIYVILCLKIQWRKWWQLTSNQQRDVCASVNCTIVTWDFANTRSTYMQLFLQSFFRWSPKRLEKKPLAAFSDASQQCQSSDRSRFVHMLK